MAEEKKEGIGHVAHDVSHLHGLIEHLKVHVEKCQNLCDAEETHKGEIKEHLGEIDEKIHEIEDHLRRIIGEPEESA